MRRSDGATFEPSYPDDYTEGAAIAAVLSRKPSWYFRRVERVPKRWWHLKEMWRRTGEIWQPEEGSDFTVLAA